MTLNITLVSRIGIHQATDFRLTRLQSGQPPSLQSDASPKQVTLNYGLCGWEAVIAYTGIGAWGGIDTCSWLVKWLKPPTWPTELQFEHMIARVRIEGTKWLAQMPVKHDCRHTFVSGAFVAGKPHVALVSNYQDFTSRPALTAAAELHVSRLQPRDPMVVVTGAGTAVSRTDRKLLQAMVRRSADPKRIRQAMADVIRRASAAPASCGIVGPSAMAYSLMSDGNGGGGEKYGEVVGEYVPHSIMHSLETRDMLNLVLQHMGSAERVSPFNSHG